ncbi:MAG: DUF3526 domain-containing protein [Pseudomonadota bacterium]
MISSISFSLEKRLFLTARPGIAALVIVAALCCIAALAGRAHVDRVETAQAAFLEEKGADLAKWRDELAALEAGKAKPAPYAARPMNIRMPAVLPSAPLSDFGTASAGLFPTATLITAWSNPANLFASYEFSNPNLLALGGFDLNFVVVVIMPLLMIAASFDVLPSDRQNGRLRLVSVQSGHIRGSTWNRLFIRNAALWAVLALFSFVWACIPAADTDMTLRLATYFAWLTIALLYGLFWFALIAASSILIKTSETLAAMLFAAWAIFIFAVPTLGGAFAEAMYPPPSRLAFLSEMRQGEVTAINDTAALTAGFLADHPEMTVSDEKVPDYYSSYFLANQEAAKRTTPVLEAFTRSQMERQSVTRFMQYVSPAIITDAALQAISGGNANRYHAFQQQAVTALKDLTQRIGPSVVAKQRLSLEQFDEIPTFEFVEVSLGDRLSKRAAPLGYLLALSIACLIFARRRLAAPLEQIL